MTEPPEPTTDLAGLLAGGDLGGLLSQAMQMQQEVMAAQAEAATAVVEGQSGGGAVRVEVTGAMEFRSVRIDPEVVDPDDVDLLADLVLAALRDASAQVQDLQARSLGGVHGIGALGAGSIGDLFGGGGPGLADDDEGDEGGDDEGGDDEGGDDEGGDDEGGGGRPLG